MTGRSRGAALVALVGFVVAASSCVLERQRSPVPVSSSRIHEDGILDPSSPDFHGTLLRDHDWDFETCASCHGADFTGGTAKAACIDCHSEGPTACVTCHASTLASGAHETHVPAGIIEPQACQGCHQPPTDWTTPGHLFLDDGSVDPAPAEVVISGLGSQLANGAQGTNAAWDTGTRTCSGVYCHGGAFADSAAANTTPAWDLVGMGEAACGSCHGTPPADHASGECVTCHAAVASGPDTIVDPSLHVNGRVDLGRDPAADPAACDRCHGSSTSPAPPSDLFGGMSTTLLGVGAHATHLFGRYGYSTSVTCGDCHVVPSVVTDPGHLDSALPADVTFGGLASTGGAAPVWDRASGTCSNVYCHGGGTRLSADATPTRNPSPQWTSVGTGEAVCGSCHGTPPQTGSHPARSDCSTCHSSVVDDFGNIIHTNGQTNHLNGTVNF